MPLPFLLPALLILNTAVPAATEPHPPNAASHTRFTCDRPFKLTRDCSIWQGPQREVVFAGHALSIAADATGQTLLVARVRRLPRDASGLAFGFSIGRRESRSLTRAIMQIAGQLADAGHELKGMTPYRRGRRTEAYFLHFAADAYAYLKRYTALPAPLGPQRQRR